MLAVPLKVFGYSYGLVYIVWLHGSKAGEMRKKEMQHTTQGLLSDMWLIQCTSIDLPG